MDTLHLRGPEQPTKPPSAGASAATELQPGPDKPRYWIAAHVYVCLTSDGAVLLDVMRNKYRGVGRKETRALGSIVHDWPRDAASLPNSSDAPETINPSRVADALLQAGLLHPAPPDSKPYIAEALSLGGDLVSIGDEIECSTPMRIRHVVTFLLALIWARIALSWQPFQVVVRNAHSARSASQNSQTEFDVQAAAALVGIFRQLRPYFFAARGQCLLHALVLVKFLARHGVPARWVIGVRTHPWAAHSWVQHGNFLLDTNPEKVCDYTPILAV